MITQLYDKTQLNSLLSLGGTELRDQFLADLERCQIRLTEALKLAQSDEQRSLKLSRHALHELRGIALTVGAASLVRHCAEAEAFCDMGKIKDVADRQTEILMICSELQTQIMTQTTGVS